jgi:SAM-dependent methyltransferase
MDRKTIKEQFGAHADHYVSSRTHARGASLIRLFELVETELDWQMLDIATGAGHTALAFAPYVDHVWATDITPEMLENTRQLAQERGLDNVTVEHADAEDLPYEDERFDLVTCRIAAHHFGAVAPFLEQAKRVLRPGGSLAVVDNILPNSLAGDYVNAFEKLRDPSHARCLSLEEWLAAYQAAGLVVGHYETLDMQLVFEEWAARHDATMQRFLRALLVGAPPEAAAFLQPQTINDRTTFRLQTGIVIGKRPL